MNGRLLSRYGRRAGKRALFLLPLLAAAVLAAEIFLRASGLDWKLLDKMLYRQRNDADAHRIDLNPDILYRLRPGRFGDDAHRVSINSFGFRGPERSAEKPAGVFRILVEGGSNVYGQGLNDEDTWPARLEERLNEGPGAGRFEVWNQGTCAYVGAQMAVLAREAAEKYDFDLAILALSNQGDRAFLWGSSAQPVFEANPALWSNLMSSSEDRGAVDFGTVARPGWLRASALYRYLALGLRVRKGYTHLSIADPESRNAAMIREFITWAEERMKTCVFLCPAVEPDLYTDYWRGTGAPVFTLRADGKPAEYADLHPRRR
ncbi:MAG: hypothetical protein M5R36_17015 [Deltaproteobacteria bacterium]|nr:hypothetical protein [Deltaproteobacteria bacterium]